MGRAFTQRLVTQMYFPGDPFFPYDPIFNSVRDERGPRAHGLALLDPRHPARLGGGLRVRHLPARSGADAVRGGALIFATTPSQTVGPYFAIGLPWVAGPHAVAPGTPGRDHDRRHDLRRRRRADPRSPDRDLAGRPRRPLRRLPRLRRRLRAGRLPRLRPLRRRGWRRHLRDRHGQAGPGARPGRPDAGAPHRRVGVRAGDASPRVSRGSTSATRTRPTPSDPVLRRVPADRLHTLIAQPDRRRRLPLRHPRPGPGRDGLL